ncbi:MAG TPA: winged helix-turn-helix domain-containing protein [Haliangiales bacterium]|nr:winged helix-turn-helix domain-containing protein [Haliangiales bacterium]
MASADEDAGPTRVALVVVAGAPAPDAVVAQLARDAFVVGASGDVALAWLPAGAGADVLERAVRGRGRGPILGCAPEGTGADSERALSAGFDDFVAGRGSPREISARLRALVRRVRTPAHRGVQPVRFGRVVLDRASQEVVVGGRRVSLTRLERRVMEALVVEGGRAIARDELGERAWGSEARTVGPRAIDNLVQRLRRKIRDPHLIVTVRGVGFRLAAD